MRAIFAKKNPDVTIATARRLNPEYPGAIDGVTPTQVFAGQSFTWGVVQAMILNPQNPPRNDSNEDSVTLKITYGDNSFIFGGDIGSAAEGDIVSSGADSDADVLLVPHHGSKYSSSMPFLNAVTPMYAVISVGDNPYGHPTQETLDRLTTIGATIYRTDIHGIIVITSDGFLITTNQNQFNYSIFLPLTQNNVDPLAENVQITYILYDGVVPTVESDEYATIKNMGMMSFNLSGWRLNAGGPGQDFYFPDYTMQPGQECRIYTNEVHHESCGFSFGSSSALWSNSGDCGYLYDDEGTLVSEYCY